MVFDNATSDFIRTNPNTLTSSAATIFTGGAEFAEVGFTGGADPDGGGYIMPNATGEGWLAIGPTAISSAILNSRTSPTAINEATFNFSLSLLDGFDDIQFFPLLSNVTVGGTADFVGGGQLQFYGDGTGAPIGPWQIGTNADVSFRAITTPEPGTLLIWVGLALIGLLSASNCRSGRVS
jgi:hypothetical protein